jgi:hypothetical protein
MVATFADSPFKQPEPETLLDEGGHFTWAAAPLAKVPIFVMTPAPMATRSSSSIAEHRMRCGSNEPAPLR